MMKTLDAIAIVAVYMGFVSTSGCASSSYAHGRDFDEKQIVKIEKGKTTSKEINALFGEPFMKNVISANEEKWMYFYTHGTAHAQGGFFTPITATSEGTNKTLDILLKDGVVSNFTFSDSPQTSTFGSGAPAPSTPQKE